MILLLAGLSALAGASPVVEHAGSPQQTAWDQSAMLFDESIHRYDLELSPAAEQSLREDPYTWVKGALVLDGVRYATVGVRVKGQNSFESWDEKPSIKVKIDKYVPGQRLLGLEELTFQNMDNDYTMMHERVAYRFYREAGFAAARAAHAVIFVNGEYRGLYTHVDSVDEHLLAQWFPDPTGPLFELWDVEFTDYWIPFFQHEEGPDDRTALQGLADALELGGTPAIAAAQQWTDVEQFVWYFAACAVIGQFDSYPWWSPGDDTHLYVDPSDGRIRWMPHGVDETFYSPDFGLLTPYGLTAATCMADPWCEQLYIQDIWALQALTERTGLLQYAEAVRAQTDPLVPIDPRKPYTDEEVAANRDAMLGFIADRRSKLAELVGPEPF